MSHIPLKYFYCAEQPLLRSFDRDLLIEYYQQSNIGENAGKSEKADKKTRIEEMSVKYFLDEMAGKKGRIDDKSIERYVGSKPEFVKLAVQRFSTFLKKRGVAAVEKSRQLSLRGLIAEMNEYNEVKSFMESSSAFALRGNKKAEDFLMQQTIVLRRIHTAEAMVFCSEFTGIPSAYRSVWKRFLFFLLSKEFHRLRPSKRGQYFELLRKI